MVERCPGRDSHYLRPDDVYEVECRECGGRVEFFKDDLSRKCPSCGVRFRNPRLDLGCAKWCRFASECVDYSPTEEAAPPDGTETCAEE